VQQFRLLSVLALGEAVEAGEHGHGQAVVEAPPLGDDDPVLEDLLDAAVHRPRQVVVGESAAGPVDQDCVPHLAEGPAGAAVLQRIGAGDAHPDRPAGVGDDSAGDEDEQEFGLLPRQPAVDPEAAAGRVEDLGGLAPGAARRGRLVVVAPILAGRAAQPMGDPGPPGLGLGFGGEARVVRGPIGGVAGSGGGEAGPLVGRGPGRDVAIMFHE
jgi:hypothetical protein